MWRNNVFRVRNCSSAATWRTVRQYHSQGLPVTIEEFEDALNGITGYGHAPPGFAISGGVDSMALASLFSRSKYSNPDVEAHPHAFIVDHKVRRESTEEAEWVAEQCRIKFGMKASVLSLAWPASFDPLDHKRFESDARTLRYQALGRACRAAGIQELLVAHHADDQAETVLMRLANNRLRSGLQAMRPVESIPECNGMHGVAHSGRGIRGSSRSSPYKPCFSFEDGGVRILRPLLGFDKSRLIATCEEQGVVWVEDKTNQLQTYTSRNAVRHILKTYKLPAALSVESLANLSKHMQERVSSHKVQARQLLTRCPKRLNPQVGSLHIQFPRFQELFDSESARSLRMNCESTKFQSGWNNAKNTAISLLAQAGQLVSPRENPSPGELASAVTHIWPEFLMPGLRASSHTEDTEVKTSYCVHGIWWRKCDRPSIEQSSRTAIHRPSLGKPVQPEWLLTRQPLLNHRHGVTPESIHYPPSHMFPLTQVHTGEPMDAVESDWQLFDGRWWISIQNFTADDLILRHFTKADLDRMPSLHTAARRCGSEKFIAVALSMLKPADTRFTLPVLVRRDMATKKETIIGFPTLDVSMGTLGSPKNICSWQVRYKKLGSEVDQHCRRIDVDFCEPLVTHAMIESELAKFGPRPKNKSIRRSSVPTEANRKSTFPPRSFSYSEEVQASSEPVSTNLSHAPKEAWRKQRTVPLVPAAESQRYGRSEKRRDGGYDIRWKDFSKRFS